MDAERPDEERGDDAVDAGSLPIDPSLLDPSSGLYSEPFFLATVSWRLITCRRVLRPLAVAMVEVVDGLPDGPTVASDPMLVASKVRETLRTADIGARLYDGSFGLMLEDTPEDGAVWAVERLRRSLEGRPGQRAVRAGIACYPGHALTPIELMESVRAAFAIAQQWPQDRIEVAGS